MMMAHDAKAARALSMKSFAQRRVRELVCGSAEVLLRRHRAFDPAGEQGILKKDDAAIGARLVAEAHFRLYPLPCKEFDGPSGELPRSAIERAVSGLKEGQQLIMCLFALISDGDACESVVNGGEPHRFNFPEGFRFGKRGSPGDPFEPLGILFHLHGKRRTSAEERAQDGGEACRICE